jgi:hypothetical protein
MKGFDFRSARVVAGKNGQPSIVSSTQEQLSNAVAVEFFALEAQRNSSGLAGLTFVGAVNLRNDQWHTRRVYQDGRLIWLDGVGI